MCLSVHPKCASLSISYLAFADDLFLLFGANCHSIKVIKDTLDEFYRSSGLKPNLQKSQIFFSGVDPIFKAGILNLLPILEGKLPVRYLGVALISTRLNIKTVFSLRRGHNKGLQAGLIGFFHMVVVPFLFGQSSSVCKHTGALCLFYLRRSLLEFVPH